jgi:hypothetical protein
MRLQLDTFLLALVSMLNELAPETNFPNYIKSQGWYEVIGIDIERKLAKKGVQLLKDAKIAVDAEARGVLPNTLPSENEPGYRTRKQDKGRKSRAGLLVDSPMANPPQSLFAF